MVALCRYFDVGTEDYGAAESMETTITDRSDPPVGFEMSNHYMVVFDKSGWGPVLPIPITWLAGQIRTVPR